MSLPIRLPALALALALLAGCASRAPRGSDGPAEQIPPDLARVTDAVPRVEPLRVGGPNKPYEVAGVHYVPLTADLPLRERGGASWYGRKFHGRPTASGEIYDMYAMTAAHKTMPLPSYARVRNPANGREIVVRVNDRGPFHADRVIDLSYTAALKLGVLGGVAPVEVERITHAQIRAGLPPAAPEGGFWLQLGAFRERDSALQLQRLLQRETPWLAALVALVEDSPWVRVQAGPWPRREQAEAMAARLAEALPLEALVLRRP
jgi:rare lipoprotein A